MAFKKAEESDYYIVRVNELYGKDAQGVTLSFPGKIVDAYEVNGQEKKIGPAEFAGGVLKFDLTRFLIDPLLLSLKILADRNSKPVTGAGNSYRIMKMDQL